MRLTDRNVLALDLAIGLQETLAFERLVQAKREMRKVRRQRAAFEAALKQGETHE